MDIIKAYAEQVASYHNPRVREDLAAEIYANLVEEYEDWQEDKPGCSPGDFLDEAKEHPMKYATRFAESGKNYLVGPRFYFSFLSTLKVSSSIILGVYFILAVMLSLTSDAYFRSLIGILAGIPVTLLWVSAIILGIFVAMERSGESASWLDNWSSSTLTPQNDKNRMSRTETFFDLGISTLGLLLVLGIVDLPLLIRHDGAWIDNWSIQLATWMKWSVGALFLFDIGFSALRLLRSYWSTRLRLVTITTNLLWVTLLIFAARQPQLIVLNESSQADFMDVMPLINLGVTATLMLIGTVIIADTLIHSWRLLKNR